MSDEHTGQGHTGKARHGARRRPARTHGHLRALTWTPPPPVVFLVPGLLGFERFSTFGYFADRVMAALRAHLELCWGQQVQVIAVPIPPTASLAERQRRLLKTMADRIQALGYSLDNVELHLLGHSTGGVDADLLTAEAPLDASNWTALDPRAPALVARIASVVSLASPHHGACITRDPVARLLSEHAVGGVGDLTHLLLQFLWSVAHDLDFSHLLTSALREGGKIQGFVREVFSDWGLIADLQPTRSRPNAAHNPAVRRHSFVTLAAQSEVDKGASKGRDGGSLRAADSFFHALAERASGRRTASAALGAAVAPTVERLQAALSGATDVPVIRNPRAVLPTELKPEHNDGVVNSARQLIDPTDPEELAAVVIGDHFDVLGYYDRRVWRVDAAGREQAQSVLAGLLHSGSGFGDEEFFALYRRIAACIAAGRQERP